MISKKHLTLVVNKPVDYVGKIAELTEEISLLNVRLLTGFYVDEEDINEARYTMEKFENRVEWYKTLQGLKK